MLHEKHCTATNELIGSQVRILGAKMARIAASFIGKVDASPLRVGVLGQHIPWIVSKCTAPWLPAQAARKASMFD